MEEKPRTTPYPLRMSDELRSKLEASAQSGSRSLHAEIVARLESTFATPTASAGPAVDLSQTVLELQSLQQLGTLNYELQRATHNLDAVQQKFSAAWNVLQQALASGDKAAQKSAKDECTRWQSTSNDLKAAIAEIEQQIGLVHFDRKANGLKELRHVQPVSVAYTGHFKDEPTSKRIRRTRSKPE